MLVRRSSINTRRVLTRRYKDNAEAGRAAMSRGIKSRLPFGVSARLDNQRDYIKAISHVTHDKLRACRHAEHSHIKRKLWDSVVTITHFHGLKDRSVATYL